MRSLALAKKKSKVKPLAKSVDNKPRLGYKQILHNQMKKSKIKKNRKKSKKKNLKFSKDNFKSLMHKNQSKFKSVVKEK